MTYWKKNEITCKIHVSCKIPSINDMCVFSLLSKTVIVLSYVVLIKFACYTQVVICYF